MQKKEKPKTLGPPIPDNHKFAPLKSTMWEGAWTMYYLSSCALLDAMANGKDALGKANFTTAGDEYCKALSNMAQVSMNPSPLLCRQARRHCCDLGIVLCGRPWYVARVDATLQTAQMV